MSTDNLNQSQIISKTSVDNIRKVMTITHFLISIKNFIGNIHYFVRNKLHFFFQLGEC